MDAARARTLLALLADGIHPLTGEPLPPDCPYQHAEIVRALYCALRCFPSGPSETAIARDPSSSPPAARANASAPAPLKGNAGKPWSAEEERELLERFDAGALPGELAKQHARSVAGIEARLEKLGRLRPDQRTTASRYPLATPTPRAKSSV